MATVTFEWDSRELNVFRGGAVDRALTRAFRLAGNQGLKVLQQGTLDLVVAKKALPRATVQEDQRARKPTRGEELKDLHWELWVRGKPVPLMKFPHQDTAARKGRGATGVVVRFGPGNVQRFSQVFTARMASGHVGLFRRTTKRSLPIEEVFSSRLPKDLGGEVITTLGDATYRKINASWLRGLDRELAKARRKGDV